MTMNAQAIVGQLFEGVEWIDAERGYMPCPGRHLHTEKGGKRDCRITIDGAPTIFCFHQSCSALVEDANYKLRFALWKESADGAEPAKLTDEDRRKMALQREKKLAEEKLRDWADSHRASFFETPWPMADVMEDSPVKVENEEDAWKLMLSLYQPTDIVWIGEPTDSGNGKGDHFKPVSEWLKSGPAGHFTCPSTFKPGTTSRSNDAVDTRPFLVIESDTLPEDKMLSMIHRLRKTLSLVAVLHTGGKSLHSWWRFPDPEKLEQLKIILPHLGCDKALFKPSQPVRLPGVKRGDKWQRLLWFDNGKEQPKPEIKTAVNKWDKELKSFPQLLEAYKESVKVNQLRNLDLSKWLPSLKKHVRPLVPGELVTVVADTGVGKTAVLSSIAYHAAAPLPTIMFEIELPDELMAERLLAMHANRPGWEIEAFAKNGSLPDNTAKFSHLTTCTLSRISIDDMEDAIRYYNANHAVPVAVVLVDYIGLIQGKGNGRYEKLSNVAENLKIMAKSCKAIVITTCQVHRDGNDGTQPVHLHAAKDSGSIENSSGLVIGAWREGERGEQLKLKILKNTKGKGGAIIDCHFDGACMRIVEDIGESQI